MSLGNMGAAGHGLYRHLWAVRTRYNQRRALIGSWMTPPTMTGAIEIERGGDENITIAAVAVAAIVVAAATATSGRNSDDDDDGGGGGDGDSEGSEGRRDNDDNGSNGDGMATAMSNDTAKATARR